jgi:hypothetical protein
VIVAFTLLAVAALLLGWMKRCRYLDDPTPPAAPVDALDRALGHHTPHPPPPASFKEHHTP